MNLLLSALSPAYRQSLLNRFKPISLPSRASIDLEEEAPKYTHFITSGIASIVSTMADGTNAKVGVREHEGLVKSFHLLGKGRVPNDCFIQMEATALVMPFSELELELQTNDEMHADVLQSVQSQGFIVGQLAPCNRLHEAEGRLVRWLLMVRDRVQTDSYHLTQEFLANILGGRRTTVTAAAGGLQRRGLIKSSRRNIQITNVEGLERVACECYGIVRRMYANFS